MTKFQGIFVLDSLLFIKKYYLGETLRPLSDSFIESRNIKITSQEDRIKSKKNRTRVAE